MFNTTSCATPSAKSTAALQTNIFGTRHEKLTTVGTHIVVGGLEQFHDPQRRPTSVKSTGSDGYFETIHHFHHATVQIPSKNQFPKKKKKIEKSVNGLKKKIIKSNQIG